MFAAFTGVRQAEALGLKWATSTSETASVA